MRTVLRLYVLAVAAAFTATVARADDPLPSWNDGKAKQSIVEFVEQVTKPGSPDFVAVPERIAVFDNDGTLWSEQPVPVQFYFVADRVKALAPQHPEWKDKEPFASILKGDVRAALEGGDQPVADSSPRCSSTTPPSRRSSCTPAPRYRWPGPCSGRASRCTWRSPSGAGHFFAHRGRDVTSTASDDGAVPRER